MKKRSIVIFALLLAVLLASGIIFHNLADKKETFEAAIFPVQEDVVEIQVDDAAVREEEPILVVDVVKEQQTGEKTIVAKVPVRTAPSRRFSEKKMWSPNKGYIVRDGVYVYFGTWTVVREEINE